MWLGYGGAWPDDAPVEGRAPSRAAVEHRQRCLALGVAARLGQLDVQHQAVAVLGEQMAQVAELRRLPRPLRVQLRLRVVCARLQELRVTFALSPDTSLITCPPRLASLPARDEDHGA